MAKSLFFCVNNNVNSISKAPGTPSIEYAEMIIPVNGNTGNKVTGFTTRGIKLLYATDDNYNYYVDNSAPTICFVKNDKIYYCGKSYTSETKASAIIPAGTYSPSAFEELIKSFISDNGSRRVAEAFSVTVNNQTVSVPVNETVYYRVNGTSSQGYVRAVWFGALNEQSSAPPQHASNSTGFTNTKAYVVYIKSINTVYTENFKNYSNFRITVNKNIKFV